MDWTFRVERHEAAPGGARSQAILPDVDKALKAAEAAGLRLLAQIDEKRSSEELVVVRVSAPKGTDDQRVMRVLREAFASVSLIAHDLPVDGESQHQE